MLLELMKNRETHLYIHVFVALDTFIETHSAFSGAGADHDML
jgi:hypothetical protein